VLDAALPVVFLGGIERRRPEYDDRRRPGDDDPDEQDRPDEFGLPAVARAGTGVGAHRMK